MKLFFLAFCTIVTLGVSAQTSSQPKSPRETVTTTDISVTYGRPYKNDRVIFGGLEKYGNVWRLGADQATTITFSRSVQFGGQNVNAGTYTMFAIPEENQWTIILNTQLGQWGAYMYEKHKDKNVVQVTVPVTTLATEVEQFTIRFPQTNSMIMEWDKTQVAVSIE